MKKIFVLAVSIAALTGCNRGGQKAGYVIEGRIAETRTDVEGRYVYLSSFGKEGGVIDSALISKNAFTFEGAATNGQLCKLSFEEEEAARPGESSAFSTFFILQDGKMQAVLDTFSYVTGTPENDAFKTVRESIATARKGYTDLVKAIRAGDREAEKKAYQIDMDVLNAVKAYIEANPTKLSAAKLLHEFRYYIDEGEQEAIFAKADSTFMSLPGIGPMVAHLEVLKSVAPGKTFVDFEMPDPKGKMRKLSDYVGQGKKVVLIDFWASWCGPCMHEMPNLTATYKTYRKKGFEIVGISLDKEEEAWLKTIKEKKMDWIHLSDLKGWKSGGAALYGVNSIPCTVLVDKDGTILARNLMGDELNKKLEELFAKK